MSLSEWGASCNDDAMITESLLFSSYRDDWMILDDVDFIVDVIQ